MCESKVSDMMWAQKTSAPRITRAMHRSRRWGSESPLTKAMSPERKNNKQKPLAKKRATLLKHNSRQRGRRWYFGLLQKHTI